VAATGQRQDSNKHHRSGDTQHISIPVLDLFGSQSQRLCRFLPQT
jgi:hypothetical protein